VTRRQCLSSSDLKVLNRQKNISKPIISEQGNGRNLRKLLETCLYSLRFQNFQTVSEKTAYLFTNRTNHS
jgi:hypothetical protein